MVTPGQGEIWWGEAPERGGRPYLVLTRNDAIPVLRELLVAPVTRTIRGIPTEMELGPDEELRTACVATFDNVTVFPRAFLTRRLGALDDARRPEVCAAMAAVMDC